VLDLSTGIKIYVGSRLYDKDKKIRSCTLFFKPDGTLSTDGLIREKVEPIPIKKTTQLTEQPIPIEERKKRSRQ
jgi:hypothetical protein